MSTRHCLEANEKSGIFIPKWVFASAQSVEWSVHQLIASVPSPSIKRNLPHMCMIFHIFGAKFISYDYLHHISILYDSNIFPRYQYELCICSSSKKLYPVLKTVTILFLNILVLMFYIYILCLCFILLKCSSIYMWFLKLLVLGQSFCLFCGQLQYED